eukprot:1192622-Prorocentrum_minimum.AAC.1
MATMAGAPSGRSHTTAPWSSVQACKTAMPRRRSPSFPENSATMSSATGSPFAVSSSACKASACTST